MWPQISDLDLPKSGFGQFPKGPKLRTEAAEDRIAEEPRRTCRFWTGFEPILARNFQTEAAETDQKPTRNWPEIRHSGPTSFAEVEILGLGLAKTSDFSKNLNVNPIGNSDF